MSFLKSFEEVLDKYKQSSISEQEASLQLKKIWLEQKANPVLYAAMDWQEQDLEKSLKVPVQVISFFSDPVDNLIQHGPGSLLYNVLRGNQFEKTSEYNYTVNSTSKEDLENLLSPLINKPDTKIIYFLKNHQDDDQLQFNDLIEQEIIPLFILLNTLINLKPEHRIDILTVFQSSPGYRQSLYQAISGLCRTLSQESKKAACRILEIDNTDHFNGNILDELAFPGPGIFEIKWENKKRYIKKLNELSDTGEQNPVSFKENGVYLITGGAGGLGLIFAEYIAKTYKATLVLTGRSQIDPSKNEKMQRLIDSGVKLDYIQADITHPEDVSRLMNTIKKNHGAINGIVHGAGIIKDNYIHKKSIEEIRSVISPKTVGTLNLDSVTKEENLDFFILFSSIAANGNAGQSDYSFANSFLDNFAFHRNSLLQEKKRTGRTVAINWPYWAEGGMHVEEQTIRLMEKTMGLKPLQTIDGIKAFELALKIKTSQLMVFPGNKKQIRDNMINPLSVKQKPATTQPAAPGDDIRKTITGFIKTEIAAILKVEKRDIDEQIDMSEYGFDSVSFTTFANTINTQYNLNLTPAVFFEYPTIDSFIQFLLKDFPGAFDTTAFIPGNETVKTASPSTLSQDETRKIIKDFLINEIAAILKVEVSDIDITSDMSEYGFDSVSFTSFANTINNKYDINLTPAVFFEYPTIISFIKFLTTVYKDQIEKTLGFSNNEIEAGGIPQDTILEENDNQTSQFRIAPNDDFSYDDFNEQSTTNEPIAIIGIAGIFPGAENLEEFWKNLEEGKDCITEIPPDRWDWKVYWGDPNTEENKTNVKWGGFIKDIDKFDAAFFNISPREAILMDPQHRLFLESVWKTIEDAGYKPSDMAGSLTGVFAGVQNMEYNKLLSSNNIPIEAHMATGNSLALLPNRISYFFNFNGPSEAIDTACASSLIAIHRAIQSIRGGDCEQAIAGGVNSLLIPETYITLSKTGALSTDGRCKTFSSDANGYARAEGVGTVLLKPLSKALKDHDHIYAVIRGSAENHGGRAKSLTAPNPNAQAQLIVKAMERANVDPSTITYIEAHGTGTSLGDPIEINALKKAYKELYEKWGNPNYGKEQHCGIASVKTNIGHLETGSGMAGIIKILLSIMHKKLPAIVHLKEINPYISFEDSPFYIIKETQEWKQIKDKNDRVIPRRAGISSFGFGGANAHLVVEEYILIKKLSINSNETNLFLFSAKDQEQLNAYIQHYILYLENKKGPLNINDLAFTLQTGREAFEERIAIIAVTINDLVLKLGQVLSKQNNENIFIGNHSDKNLSRLMLDGREGEEFLRIIIAEKKFSKLAQLWVSGVEVDWKLFWKGKDVHKISLPTYPFEKKRYWFELLKDKYSMNIKAPSIENKKPIENNFQNQIISPQNHNNSNEKQIKQRIILKVKDLLKIEETRNIETKPLEELGMDSIVSIQFLKIINHEFAISLKIVDIYDSTITKLSQLILSKIPLQNMPVNEEGVL